MIKGIIRLLAFITGWKIQGDDLLMTSNSPIVFTFPHTSAYDAIISLILGRLLNVHVFAVAWEGQYKNFWKRLFLSSMNVVPINNDGGNGTVNTIINAFENQININPCKKVVFCISPEGTREYTDRLRSGYYYIARKMGADIVIGGLDYETHTLHFNTIIPYEHRLTLETCNEKVIESFYSIVPLYPDKTFYDCKSHHATNRSIIDYCCITTWVSGLFIGISSIFMFNHVFAGMITILGLPIPGLYHYYNENKYIQLFDKLYVWLNIVLYSMYYTSVSCTIHLMVCRIITLCIIVVSYYTCGINNRTSNPWYYKSHAIFHMTLCLPVIVETFI